MVSKIPRRKVVVYRAGVDGRSRSVSPPVGQPFDFDEAEVRQLGNSLEDDPAAPAPAKAAPAKPAPKPASSKDD